MITLRWDPSPWARLHMTEPELAEARAHRGRAKATLRLGVNGNPRGPMWGSLTYPGAPGHVAPMLVRHACDLGHMRKDPPESCPVLREIIETLLREVER